MYLLYNSLDFKGIYIFTLIMSAFIAIVFFKNLIKEKNRLLLSFGIACVAIYFSKNVFSARNQIFSFLIFKHFL